MKIYDNNTLRRVHNNVIINDVDFAIIENGELRVENYCMNVNDNIIAEKSKAFAVRIIKMYKFLTSEKKEFVISRQVLKSGTSIGANIRETRNAQSRADFLSKMNIALKEADETQYWLELLSEAGYITAEQFASIYKDCDEIISILTKIIKSVKAGG